MDKKLFRSGMSLLCDVLTKSKDKFCLIGIVKAYFRGNEIGCRILEIEDLSKNVRKTKDRTFLNQNKYIYFNLIFQD